MAANFTGEQPGAADRHGEQVPQRAGAGLAGDRVAGRRRRRPSGRNSGADDQERGERDEQPVAGDAAEDRARPRPTWPADLDGDADEHRHQRPGRPAGPRCGGGGTISAELGAGTSEPQRVEAPKTSKPSPVRPTNSPPGWAARRRSRGRRRRPRPGRRRPARAACAPSTARRTVVGLGRLGQAEAAQDRRRVGVGSGSSTRTRRRCGRARSSASAPCHTSRPGAHHPDVRCTSARPR